MVIQKEEIKYDDDLWSENSFGEEMVDENESKANE